MTSKTSRDPATLRGQKERALFKGLVISYFDLSEARQFLLGLTTRDGRTSRSPDEELCTKALRTALVGAYARPFSGNRGEHGNPDPLPGRLLKSLTKQQPAVHSRILKLRKTEFAHSDAANASVRISVDRWPDGFKVSPIGILVAVGSSVVALYSIWAVEWWLRRRDRAWTPKHPRKPT